MCETSIHTAMPISYTVAGTAGLAADVRKSIRDAFPSASQDVLNQCSAATSGVAKEIRVQSGDVIEFSQVVPKSGQLSRSEQPVRATVIRGGMAVAGYIPTGA